MTPSVYVVGDVGDVADVQAAVGVDVAVVGWVCNDDALVNLISMLPYDVVVFVSGWRENPAAVRFHATAVEYGLRVQYRQKGVRS